MENQETEEVVMESTAPRRRSFDSSGNVRTPFFNFLDKHRKLITIIGGSVIGLIILFSAYKYFYLNPQEQEGEVVIFKAQRLFEVDSFKQALNGGKGVEGMQDIADDYSMTKVGNLAKYYAGMSLLQQGKYEDAIENLKSFSSNSPIIMPMALGGIGDAYSQLKDYDNAVEYYMKAAEKSDNAFTAPRYYKKAGLVYEQLGEFGEALKVYQKIKDKYKATEYSADIDKYIMRAQAGVDRKSE